MRFFLIPFLSFLLNMSAMPTIVLADAPAQPRWAQSPYAYPQLAPIKIDAWRLGRCMAAAAIHDFPQLSARRDQMNLPYTENSFFNYLRCSIDGYLGFNTGTESELKEWILSQPDNSIDPLKLFRKSLELNQGNVWNALLANYDLLRLNARWWDRDNYYYFSTHDRQSKFFNKLIDIRGDLRERGGDFKGDHAGGWYRIWGIMLYRAMQEPEMDWTNLPNTISSRLNNIFRNAKVETVAALVEYDKRLDLEFGASSEDDWNKTPLNLAGERALGEMIRALAKRQVHPLPDLKYCETPETYLISDIQ